MGMGEMSEDSGFARSIQDLAATSAIVTISSVAGGAIHGITSRRKISQMWSRCSDGKLSTNK
jgi:hypothetical protein